MLAALVLLPCADGMLMADSTAHGGSAAMTGDATTIGSSMTVVRVETDRPGPGDLGGVLGTCLVFLVAVVAMAVGLRPAQSLLFAPILACGRLAIRRVIRARAPTLAQLCLLRT